MLYGIAPVEQCLRHRRRSIERLWVKAGKPSPRLKTLLQLAREAGVPVEEADLHALGQRAGTRLHQGVVLDCGPRQTLDLDTYLQARSSRSSCVLALDQIEDPQNLGGLIRTAAFLGASAVLIHRSHRAPLSAAASKASAGAMEFFEIIEVANLARALARLAEELHVVIGSVLDDSSVDYRRLEVSERMVVVVGNEGSGLRALTRKRCQQLVHIPGRGEAQSLNVTVAAGVLLSRFLDDLDQM